MIDFEDIVIKLKPLPWRLSLYIVGGSFVGATAISTLIGWLLLSSVQSQKAKPGMVPAVIGKTDVAVIHPMPTESDIEKILKRNIFNSEGSLGDDAGEDDSPEAIPKSDLPIKLLGLIYGGNPYNGMATIENTAKQNAVNSFLVGDMILKEAKLVEIHRRRIIIDRNGQKEYVELVDNPVRRSSRLASKTPTTVTTTSGITPVVSRPPPPTFREPGFDREGGKMKMSGDYKDRLLSGDEFTKVLQDAKAEPYTADGSLKGFRLTKIRENSIYDKAGLQNDDIVEEINGVPLNDTAAAIRLLQQLRNEK